MTLRGQTKQVRPPRVRELAVGALRIKFRRFCWGINAKFRKSVTVSTKQGIFTVLLGPNESPGRSLYCYREHELDLMLKAMTFLRSMELCPPKGEGTVLDVGANNGVTSIGMLRLGELERAIAIEPEPRNFALLKHNVSQNSLDGRVICLPAAASHQKGDILFEVSDANDGDHRVRTNGDYGVPDLFQESGRRVMTVQTGNLCDLLSDVPKQFTQNIAVIWIDVQGHEGYVFLGARKLLSGGAPVVSEIWPYGIRRSGMGENQFCDIAESIWSSYWVMRRGRFVRYPINTLAILFDELGFEGDFDNVIFTR